MKDYYTAFVKYSLKLCRTFEGLKDSRLQQMHNRAMTGQHKLKLEMYAEPDRCAEVARVLLMHEDENIRISAGAYCIQAGIHLNQAVSILQSISETGSTRYMRFSAKQCLRYCKPFDMD